jgi:hypothetical protein
MLYEYVYYKKEVMLGPASSLACTVDRLLDKIEKECTGNSVQRVVSLFVDIIHEVDLVDFHSLLHQIVVQVNAFLPPWCDEE